MWVEFSRVEQSVAYAFLNEFSISGSPKRVLTPLKKTSKTHTQPFLRTKNAHFRPSDEISMKKVEKDAVNTTIGPICDASRMKIRKKCILEEFYGSQTKILERRKVCDPELL
jgi:hypothetical protein